jgi:mevalonate kinase
MAGIVTPGAGAGGCTITFAVPYKNTPACTVTEQTMSLTNALGYTVSKTAITVTETSLSSVLNYTCIGLGD